MRDSKIALKILVLLGLVKINAGPRLADESTLPGSKNVAVRNGNKSTKSAIAEQETIVSVRFFFMGKIGKSFSEPNERLCLRLNECRDCRNGRRTPVSIDTF